MEATKRVEKVLMKITKATFGHHSDYPLFGPQFHFSGNGTGISDGAKYMINLGMEPWEKQYGVHGEAKRNEAVTETIIWFGKILMDAKVLTIDHLIGKPVEVTIINNMFNDFRILTEVI